MSGSDPLASNPFKGLHYYTEADRALFFGRDRETDELLRLVVRDVLTVLFARSGLGKTSLLRAGLMPRMREHGFLPVLVRIDYSETAPAPAAQVLAATLAAAAEARLEVDTGQCLELPENIGQWRGTLWEFFHCCQFWSLRNDPVRPVLILDQFEELFTLGQSSPRAAELVAQLGDLAEDRMPRRLREAFDRLGRRPGFDTRADKYKLLFAVREDYVARLDALRPEMPSVMRNRFGLEPLSRARALEVTGKAGGSWMSDAVAQLIVAAVAGEDEFPKSDGVGRVAADEIEPAYLSVMCDELFRRMVAQGEMAIDAELVRTERGNILDSLYQRSFHGLTPAVRVFVEDRLLTPGGFRGSVPVAEAVRDGVARANLDRLVDSRLLRYEERLGTTQVELSHDLLTPIVRQHREQRRAQAEAGRLAERLRRERRRLWVSVAVAALLVAGIGFYAMGWVVEHHTYCRSFSKRLGAAYPVGELPASAAAHRRWTFRLTSDGWFGPVHTLEVIAANGQPASDAPIKTYLSDSDKASGSRGISRGEFVYDRDDRVVSEVAYDRAGRMLWGLVYTKIETASDGRPRSAKAMFFGPDGLPQPQRNSRAEFLEIRYDDSGFEAEMRYSDREGNPMPGPDSAYGQSREFDNRGRETRRTSVDANGKPMIDQAGNAGMEIGWDSAGNLIEERAFDSRKEATLVRPGYFRSQSRYDRWGRTIEQRFFDLNGNPVLETAETSAHRVVWEYDDQGNQTSLKLFDKVHDPVVAGAPMLFDFPAHEARYAYDSKNHLTWVSYFGENGLPLTGPAGWHGYRLEYDAAGFTSAFSTFDERENPALDKTTGVHRWEIKNDEFGRRVEERFYDKGRNPILTADSGYHLRRSEYDKAGHVSAVSYFDTEGRPTADRTTGSYRWTARYDRFGNETDSRFLDAAGEPINGSQGFQRIESKYDEYGSLIERRWYDKEDRPTAGPDGVEVFRNTYDKRGLLARRAYFDASGQAALDRRGIHEVLMDHNDKRQQTRYEVFGLKGTLAEDGDGNHLMVTEYDERGRETGNTQLRANGGPNMDRELGIATVRYLYDRDNKWTEQAFYDEVGGLVSGFFGFAKATFEPQPDGRVAQINYGADGKPAFNPLYGFAIKKTDPRRLGETVDSYYGPDAAPMEGPEGYAEVWRRWDDAGKLVTEAYFGLDRKPVSGPQGYHRMERPPGAEPRYFDTEGQDLAGPGAAAPVPVIRFSEITNVKAPAAKAGMHAGDILWRYGDWSYPDALIAMRAVGRDSDKELESLAEQFFAERDRLAAGLGTLTVIRHGRPVRLVIPPLSDKTLGARLGNRWVPAATFAAWRDLETAKP